MGGYDLCVSVAHWLFDCTMKETTAFQFRVTVKYSHRLFNNGHTLKLRPAIPVKGLRWKIDVIVSLFDKEARKTQKMQNTILKRIFEA